ncbi:hypothetical protein V7114_23930 [Neobacillus niacini]|uniref:hypothetical protein n=1 Tax=Neobacillus niacini TaxID=86668 RepID=UPI002FFDC6D8
MTISSQLEEYRVNRVLSLFFELISVGEKYPGVEGFYVIGDKKMVEIIKVAGRVV